MTDKYITNLKIRGIKKISIQKYFDQNNTEFREIMAIDENGDAHIIKFELDAK